MNGCQRPVAELPVRERHVSGDVGLKATFLNEIIGLLFK